MRGARHLSKLLVVLSLTGTSLAAVSETAFAQQASEEDIAQARQLGQQAQAAADAGNYADAEKLWAAARKLYPVAPTLTLGLARAQAKLGKVVAAQENYNKIIREWSSHPNPPPAFANALEAAKAEVGSVSARVANVVITVEGATSPNVMLDGQPVPLVALGLKRPVDPGSHTVHAEAQGYKPADTTFQVTDGGTAEAKLKLEKAPETPVAGGAPTGQPTQPTEPQQQAAVSADTGGKGSSNKTLAVVALGVGAVGLVVGGVTGAIAMSKHGDLADQCPNATCPPDKQSDVDSYKTMGTVSTIGFIVGGAGIVAGAVLWLTAPKASSTTAAKARVLPYLGVGSAGVTGTF